jgi:hypothetical protein
MQSNALEALISLIPFLIVSCLMGFVAKALAKDKGRDVVLWTILGCIPFLNMFCIPFFIGAANLRLERKVDEVLRRLTDNPTSA